MPPPSACAEKSRKLYKPPTIAKSLDSDGDFADGIGSDASDEDEPAVSRCSRSARNAGKQRKVYVDDSDSFGDDDDSVVGQRRGLGLG